MKKVFLLIAIIASAISMNAQTKSINLELLGSSGMAGINYDARLKGNHGFGYSVGLGYGFSSSSFDFPMTEGKDGNNHQIGIPVEINYLFGQRNGHFVLGIGGYAGAIINEAAKKPQIGYTAFADIAYRYQKPKGFSFAIGFKPNLSGQVFWPYITIGKSF